MKEVKRYTVSGFTATKQHIDRLAVDLFGPEEMKVSDGFHTMDELYEHRMTLYIALCRSQWESHPHYVGRVWRSKMHSDGSSFDGWFILGIDKRKGKQITYHLPIARWEQTEFAETLDNAPEWDNHTSADVLQRLIAL